MAAIAEAGGERQKLTKAGTAELIIELLETAGLPHSIEGFEEERIMEGILVDKKNLSGSLNLILISEPGRAFIHPVPKEHLGDYIRKGKRT